MTITRVKLQRFTAFEDFDFRPSPGINVLVGANGTGKTHLMRIAYAACNVSKTGSRFAEKIVSVFMPSERAIGRLVKRRGGKSSCSVCIERGESLKLQISFSNQITAASGAAVKYSQIWSRSPVESVYIPVKEMLANAPGFRSLHAQREIHFEEVYSDILDHAYRPAPRGPTNRKYKEMLAILHRVINGKVGTKNEGFILRGGRRGNLEFSLLAEGMRKLGLLWLLIQNGTLAKGSVLFWDEPETNLNPSLFHPLMRILLQLQRLGVQIFISTHDYVVLKELDLMKEGKDKVAFHSLYRDDGDEIACHEARNLPQIHPNAIFDTFDKLYDREVRRSLERRWK